MTVKTMVTEQNNVSNFTVPRNSLIDKGEKITFEIKGLVPERSYEDRSVYMCISKGGSMWLHGEDAIRLGTMLINHGRYALEANMINHQAIHIRNCFRKHVSRREVFGFNVRILPLHPVDHGSGFVSVRLSPCWDSTVNTIDMSEDSLKQCLDVPMRVTTSEEQFIQSVCNLLELPDTNMVRIDEETLQHLRDKYFVKS